MSTTGIDWIPTPIMTEVDMQELRELLKQNNNGK
jgi:hypothetical protein